MNEPLTPELLAQARTAETPEALLTLAVEQNVTLTAEEAQAYFDLLHKSGAISDEELDNVSGGGCKHHGKMVVTPLTFCPDYVCWKCKKCGGYTQSYWSNIYEKQRTFHNCGGKDLDNYHRCTYCKYYIQEAGLSVCDNPKAYC